MRANPSYHVKALYLSAKAERASRLLEMFLMMRLRKIEPLDSKKGTFDEAMKHKKKIYNDLFKYDLSYSAED
jgi:hypothetical protein